MQIRLGFPEPREVSSLPLLKLVQAGVARARAVGGVRPRVWLPITVAMLEELCSHWPSYLALRDWKMVALTCFYGFFRAGELTIAIKEAYNSVIHLSVRDLSLDSNRAPTVVKIHPIWEGG